MVKWETQINDPKDKEIDNDAQGLTPERWHKKMIWITKEENLPALKIARMHLYDGYILKRKQRKTNCSDQWKNWQYKDKENNKKEEKEKERKKD